MATAADHHRLLALVAFRQAAPPAFRHPPRSSQPITGEQPPSSRQRRQERSFSASINN
jgi:hypothetical protein